MCRKSLHVRTVISHFLEIGEVLNIETWRKDGLLLLENIVYKLAEKMISLFECARVAAIKGTVPELMQLYSLLCCYLQ